MFTILNLQSKDESNLLCEHRRYNQRKHSTDLQNSQGQPHNTELGGFFKMKNTLTLFWICGTSIEVFKQQFANI